MSNTPRLGLPLLQAAQAQKHVTVNEALVRLDGLAQLTLKSITVSLPPVLASDGDCYGIAVGGVNDWAGQDGNIAIYSNGGWVFSTPLTGWNAWVEDTASRVMFDGSVWVAGVAAMSPNGAAMIHQVVEYDHLITAGATSTITSALPASTIVFGITGRVLTPLSGALTGWRLGVSGSDDRYGSGLGLSTGSWIRGLTSSPLTYYSSADLVLTSEGADFVDGQVRLAVHLAQLTLPST